MKPKILVGTCVRQDAKVLDAYLQALKWQQADAQIDLAFIDDGGHKEQLEAAGATKVFEADARPDDAEYEIGPDTHKWSVPTFYHLAKQKQKLFVRALNKGYDYLWLVDSDLICDPTTLRSLLSLQAPVANAVFWTHWHNVRHDVLPLPQVWLRHPYELSGRGISKQEFVKKLQEREAMQVAGGGACTLIRRDALERGVSYLPIPGLPQGGMWQGEDRHFAIRAERLRVPQYADGWPDIFHAYHPHQRESIVLDQVVKALSSTHTEAPKYGDQVSVVINPLQSPQLQKALQPQHRSIRGRLGAIPFVPEIEVALGEMKPGDKQLVSCAFPDHYRFEEYAGKVRLLEVELIDVKPYSVQPVLSDHVFRGLD